MASRSWIESGATFKVGKEIFDNAPDAVEYAKQTFSVVYQISPKDGKKYMFFSAPALIKNKRRK